MKPSLVAVASLAVLASSRFSSVPPVQALPGDAVVVRVTSLGPEPVRFSGVIVSDDPSAIRQMDYTYYNSSESNGNPGDLKKAVLKDASGNVLDTQYYRYYKAGDTGGYAGGLKYSFGSDSYGRLSNAYSDPTRSAPMSRAIRATAHRA